MDIFFYEAFDEEVRLLKQFLAPGTKAGYTARTIQASRHVVPPASLISIRTQSIIPLRWAAKLDGILARSAGYDHLAEYRRRCRIKVPCGHLTDYCSRAVAEQAILLMLALMRRLPQQLMQMARFDRAGLTGVQAGGRRALVIGVGRIGREIVRLCRALDMEVRGVDICRRENDLEYVTLARGMRWADVIFLALPLTPATQGLLTAGFFADTARQPFVINVARGELTPVAVLIRLLEKGKVAGVALDVFSDEGVLAERLRAPAKPSPLVAAFKRLAAFRNVISTPHNAFNTREALQEKCRQTAAAGSHFLRQGKFPQTVP